MTGKSSRFSSGGDARSCRLQSHHIEIVPLFLHKCLNSGPAPWVLHRTAADAADKDSEPALSISEGKYGSDLWPERSSPLIS